jgi:hypothetical protein
MNIFLSISFRRKEMIFFLDKFLLNYTMNRISNSVMRFGFSFTLHI